MKKVFTFFCEGETIPDNQDCPKYTSCECVVISYCRDEGDNLE